MFNPLLITTYNLSFLRRSTTGSKVVDYFPDVWLKM